jgi:hypothetical protein
VTIYDEFFHFRDFILKTIHGYILEEYWKISERNIKLNVNLLNYPVNRYEMDSNKPSKRLICYHMLLLSNNYFFASKTSSLHGRHKLYQMTQVCPPSSVSPRTTLAISSSFV